MYWNHRVFVKHTENEDSYYIAEVFYDDDNHAVNGYTGPIDPYGETLDELKKNLEWMVGATSRPVLCEQTGKECKHDPRPTSK